MIEQAHEKHVIKLAGQFFGRINRTLLDLDLKPQGLGRETSLAQIAVVDIDSDALAWRPASSFQ